MGPDTVALLLAALALAWFFYRSEKRNAALNRRIRNYGVASGEKSPQSRLLRMFGRLSGLRQTRDWLRDRASRRIAAGVFFAAGGAAWVFTREWWPVLPAAAGSAVAVSYYRGIVKKRAIRESFLNDLPDAVDAMARLVHAGISVEMALGEMGKYFSEPIRSRFLEVQSQLELGVPFGAVMRKLATDIPVPELEFFCTVLAINREIGGRISDILTRLSHSLRDRLNARRGLEVLTSEPRTSAKIVAFIAVAIIAMQMVLNPDNFHFLLYDPTGRTVLAYAAASIVLGLLIIRRMTRFE